MSKKRQIEQTDDYLAKISKIEERLRRLPDDLENKQDLAQVLSERYVHGEYDTDDGAAADLARLRSLLKDLPKTQAFFPRAYVAYLDEKDAEAVSWLRKYASFIAGKNGLKQIGCVDLYTYFLFPFQDPTPQFWTKLSRSLDAECPGSAASYVLRATAEFFNKNDRDSVMSALSQALQTDSGYWFAAWDIGLMYAEEKNWQSAAVYYSKALESKFAEMLALLHLDYSWALGKLKRFTDEERHLRRCLKIAPDHEHALNNLGWCLYKQGKYEQALKIFDKCIAEGRDGKYPIRNRMRTLTKLGRYAEAITDLKAASKGKVPSGSVMKEISRLENLIVKKSRSLKTSIDEIDNVFVDEDIETEGDVESTQPRPMNSVVNTTISRTAMQTEQSLEDTIERLIKRGTEIFGRRLEMYHSSSGASGRQFIIPGLGRIDLLTQDLKSGDLVVVELKRDESHDNVVGQISMYMTWVRENLAKKDQRVCGVICVGSSSEKLTLAARNVSGLDVFEYSLSFRKI